MVEMASSLLLCGVVSGLLLLAPQHHLGSETGIVPPTAQSAPAHQSDLTVSIGDLFTAALVIDGQPLSRNARFARSNLAEAANEPPLATIEVIAQIDRSPCWSALVNDELESLVYSLALNGNTFIQVVFKCENSTLRWSTTNIFGELQQGTVRASSSFTIQTRNTLQRNTLRLADRQELTESAQLTGDRESEWLGSFMLSRSPTIQNNSMSPEALDFQIRVARFEPSSAHLQLRAMNTGSLPISDARLRWSCYIQPGGSRVGGSMVVGDIMGGGERDLELEIPSGLPSTTVHLTLSADDQRPKIVGFQLSELPYSPERQSQTRVATFLLIAGGGVLVLFGWRTLRSSERRQQT